MSIQSKRFATGLVIGKFYPPHLGHHHLIDVAESQCLSLTVIVCWKPEESVPASIRIKDIQSRHPDARVLGVEDTILDDDSSEKWATFTRTLIQPTPQAVFTSEDYGHRYAELLGAVHVQVDKDRAAVPCSGTAIRHNPLDNLHFLTPFMRSFFIKRICVVGAESSGTTTLAQALAEHYDTEWVPEYGREYCDIKATYKSDYEWSTDDFVHIAKVQCRMEDELAQRANRVLICDTDPFATSIWHTRYMGFSSSEVVKIAGERRYDLYILTGDEIPFTQDGTRDGEHIRHWMHEEFVRQLDATGRNWILVSGSHSERMAAATACIDGVLADRQRSGDYS